MIRLGIQTLILFAQHRDGVGQLIASFGARAQQYFQPGGVARFIGEVAAQFDQLDA